MNAYADSVQADPHAPPIDPWHHGQVRLPNKQRRRIGLYVLSATLDAAAIATAPTMAATPLKSRMLIHVANAEAVSLSYLA